MTWHLLICPLLFSMTVLGSQDNDKLIRLNKVQHDPVQAGLAEDVTLPCIFLLDELSSFSPKDAPKLPRIKWTKVQSNTQSKPKMVPILLVKENLLMVARGYEGRVALPGYSENRYNATLAISEVRFSDSGIYWCQVIIGIDDEQDTVPLEVKGLVFHYQASNHYGLTFQDAEKACQENSAVIASPKHLQAALEDGLDNCDAGWLSDQSVRYPIKYPRPGCYGDLNNVPGVRMYTNRDLHGHYDVYCYIKDLKGTVRFVSKPTKQTFQDATLSCQEQGGSLATVGQLYLARIYGLDQCDPGWLADGSVRYPITTPRKNCGGELPGVRTVYQRPNQTGFPNTRDKFDAYCFQEFSIPPNQEQTLNIFKIPYVATPETIEDAKLGKEEQKEPSNTKAPGANTSEVVLHDKNNTNDAVAEEDIAETVTKLANKIAHYMPMATSTNHVSSHIFERGQQTLETAPPKQTSSLPDNEKHLVETFVDEDSRKKSTATISDPSRFNRPFPLVTGKHSTQTKVILEKPFTSIAVCQEPGKLQSQSNMKNSKETKSIQGTTSTEESLQKIFRANKSAEDVTSIREEATGILEKPPGTDMSDSKKKPEETLSSIHAIEKELSRPSDEEQKQNILQIPFVVAFEKVIKKAKLGEEEQKDSINQEDQSGVLSNTVSVEIYGDVVTKGAGYPGPMPKITIDQVIYQTMENSGQILDTIRPDKTAPLLDNKEETQEFTVVLDSSKNIPTIFTPSWLTKVFSLATIKYTTDTERTTGKSLISNFVLQEQGKLLKQSNMEESRAPESNVQEHQGKAIPFLDNSSSLFQDTYINLITAQKKKTEEVLSDLQPITPLIHQTSPETKNVTILEHLHVVTKTNDSSAPVTTQKDFPETSQQPTGSKPDQGLLEEPLKSTETNVTISPSETEKWSESTTSLVTKAIAIGKHTTETTMTTESIISTPVLQEHGKLQNQISTVERSEPENNVQELRARATTYMDKPSSLFQDTHINVITTQNQTTEKAVSDLQPITPLIDHISPETTNVTKSEHLHVVTKTEYSSAPVTAQKDFPEASQQPIRNKPDQGHLEEPLQKIELNVTVSPSETEKWSGNTTSLSTKAVDVANGRYTTEIKMTTENMISTPVLQDYGKLQNQISTEQIREPENTFQELRVKTTTYTDKPSALFQDTHINVMTTQNQTTEKAVSDLQPITPLIDHIIPETMNVTNSEHLQVVTKTDDTSTAVTVQKTFAETSQQLTGKEPAHGLLEEPLKTAELNVTIGPEETHKWSDITTSLFTKAVDVATGQHTTETKMTTESTSISTPVFQEHSNLQNQSSTENRREPENSFQELRTKTTTLMDKPSSLFQATHINIMTTQNEKTEQTMSDLETIIPRIDHIIPEITNVTKSEHLLVTKTKDSSAQENAQKGFPEASQLPTRNKPYQGFLEGPLERIELNVTVSPSETEKWSDSITSLSTNAIDVVIGTHTSEAKMTTENASNSTPVLQERSDLKNQSSTEGRSEPENNFRKLQSKATTYMDKPFSLFHATHINMMTTQNEKTEKAVSDFEPITPLIDHFSPETKNVTVLEHLHVVTKTDDSSAPVTAQKDFPETRKQPTGNKTDQGLLEEPLKRTESNVTLFPPDFDVATVKPTTRTKITTETSISTTVLQERGKLRNQISTEQRSEPENNFQELRSKATTFMDKPSSLLQDTHIDVMTAQNENKEKAMSDREPINPQIDHIIPETMNVTNSEHLLVVTTTKDSSAPVSMRKDFPEAIKQPTRNKPDQGLLEEPLEKIELNVTVSPSETEKLSNNTTIFTKAVDVASGKYIEETKMTIENASNSTPILQERINLQNQSSTEDRMNPEYNFQELQAKTTTYMDKPSSLFQATHINMMTTQNEKTEKAVADLQPFTPLIGHINPEPKNVTKSEHLHVVTKIEDSSAPVMAQKDFSETNQQPTGNKPDQELLQKHMKRIESHVTIFPSETEIWSPNATSLLPKPFDVGTTKHTIETKMTTGNTLISTLVLRESGNRQNLSITEERSEPEYNFQERRTNATTYMDKPFFLSEEISISVMNSRKTKSIPAITSTDGSLQKSTRTKNLPGNVMYVPDVVEDILEKPIVTDSNLSVPWTRTVATQNSKMEKALSDFETITPEIAHIAETRNVTKLEHVDVVTKIENSSDPGVYSHTAVSLKTLPVTERKDFPWTNEPPSEIKPGYGLLEDKLQITESAIAVFTPGSKKDLNDIAPSPVHTIDDVTKVTKSEQPPAVTKTEEPSSTRVYSETFEGVKTLPVTAQKEFSKTSQQHTGNKPVNDLWEDKLKITVSATADFSPDSKKDIKDVTPPLVHTINDVTKITNPEQPRAVTKTEESSSARVYSEIFEGVNTLPVTAQQEFSKTNQQPTGNKPVNDLLEDKLKITESAIAVFSPESEKDPKAVTPPPVHTIDNATKVIKSEDPHVVPKTVKSFPIEVYSDIVVGWKTLPVTEQKEFSKTNQQPTVMKSDNGLLEGQLNRNELDIIESKKGSFTTMPLFRDTSAKIVSSNETKSISGTAPTKEILQNSTEINKQARAETSPHELDVTVLEKLQVSDIHVVPAWTREKVNPTSVLFKTDPAWAVQTRKLDGAMSELEASTTPKLNRLLGQEQTSNVSQMPFVTSSEKVMQKAKEGIEEGKGFSKPEWPETNTAFLQLQDQEYRLRDTTTIKFSVDSTTNLPKNSGHPSGALGEPVKLQSQSNFEESTDGKYKVQERRGNATTFTNKLTVLFREKGPYEMNSKETKSIPDTTSTEGSLPNSTEDLAEASTSVPDVKMVIIWSRASVSAKIGRTWTNEYRKLEESTSNLAPSSQIFPSVYLPIKAKHQHVTNKEDDASEPNILLYSKDPAQSKPTEFSNNNECDSSPCQNGATCINQIDDFHCICLPTYKGAYCEIDIEGCKPNWKKFQAHCYHYFPQRRTWGQAEQECQRRHGHLTSIHSVEEQEYLNSLSFDNTWIGLNELRMDNVFQWTDSTFLQFENWKEKPPNRFSTPGENCVAIIYQDIWTWNYVPCNIKLPYICKADTAERIPDEIQENNPLSEHHSRKKRRKHRHHYHTDFIDHLKAL